MNHTYFNIKLFKNPFNISKVREFNSTIKLKNPIRGAKFIQIINIFIKDVVLLVKCDLVDQNYSYTNIIDANNYDTENIFNSQIVFVGYGLEPYDLIKIDESKSLINEFSLNVKILDNKNFDLTDISRAFIKIKIYHE